MANYNVNLFQAFNGGNIAFSPTSLSGLEAGDTVTFFFNGDGFNSVTLSNFNSAYWTNANNVSIPNGGSTVKTVRTAPDTGTDFISASGSTGGSGSIGIGIVGGNAVPDQFNFTNRTNRDFGVRSSSNTQTISGITTTASVSISGHSSRQWRKNTGSGWGSWTSAAGTVENGDQVQVRVTTSLQESTGHSCTLNIEGVTSTYTATTGTADVTINMYAVSVGGGEYEYVFTGTGTVVLQGQAVKFNHTTSGSTGNIVVSGFTSAGFTNTGNVTIARGSHTVKRTQSNADLNAVLTANHSAANNTQNFIVQIAPPADTNPNAFTFSAVTGAIPNTEYTVMSSNITGYNRDLTVTVPNDVLYSVDRGITWWTHNQAGRPQLPRPLPNSTDRRISLRAYSPNNFGGSRTVSLSAGQRSASWALSNRSGVDPNEFIQTRTTQSGFRFRRDVQEFFAGDDVIGPVTAPTELSAFVRGGNYVPNITQNNSVPTSSNGMQLSDFVGAGTYLALEQGGADRSAFGDTTIGQTSRFVEWQVYPSNETATLDNPRVGFGLILGGCQVSWTISQDSSFDQLNVSDALSVPNGAYADNRYVCRITATAPANSERTYMGTLTMRVRLKADTSKILTRVFNYSIFFKGP